MNRDDYVLATLDRIKLGCVKLSSKLSPGDHQVLKARLVSAWGPDDSTTKATGYRRSRTRRVYDELQDLDHNLFLAVVLGINPTECGQAKFKPVVAHLRNLDGYDTYRISPKPPTVKTLNSLATRFPGNERLQRLVQSVFAQPFGQQPSTAPSMAEQPPTASPVEERSLIEFAFSQVPMDKVPLLATLVVEAVTTSRKFVQEGDQGATKTECVNIFLRPNMEDGSIILTAGKRKLHEIRKVLRMVEWDLNKT